MSADFVRQFSLQVSRLRVNLPKRFALSNLDLVAAVEAR